MAGDPWQRIAEVVHDRIVSGELAPGTRLMETELAVEFSTSRGPVRTAMQELARQGLVVVNRRRGTFVLPFSASDIDEIFSLFGVLLPFAYELACDRMTADDLARLRALVDVVEGPQEDLVGWSDETMRFQRALLEIAGHRRLLAIWDGIEAQARMLARLLAVADPGEIPDAADFQSLVFEALARRDAATAGDLARRYTAQMREAFALGRVHERPLGPTGRPVRTVIVDRAHVETGGRRSGHQS